MKGKAVSKLMIFTGLANPKLAQQVADTLQIPLGNADVSRFSDGEVMVEINENVRGATFSSFSLPVPPPMKT